MSIDYGMGQTNIDHTTGIRYGVISQNTILQAWADSSEPEYAEVEATEREDGDGSELYDDSEPIGWTVNDGDYIAQDCLDNDVMVSKSPFFTFAPFCSPCVPGAGNLDDAAKRFLPHDIELELQEFARAIGTQIGVQAYCFGHDWFDDGFAPYPVYGVVSGRLCFPDSWYGR